MPMPSFKVGSIAHNNQTKQHLHLHLFATMKLLNFFSSSKKPKKHSKNTSIRSFTSSTASSSSDVGSATPKSVLTSCRTKADPLISRRELELVLRRILSSDEEVAAMLAEASSRAEVDGNYIAMEEILALCCPDDASGFESVELKETFSVFDTDGDGKISAEELHGVLMLLMGEDGGCSLKDCRRMIRAVDADGNGFVGFQDFVRMMREAQR